MVNLVEKIELHDTLNPKLWDLDSRLDEEVADKLQEIVDQFILELEENNIPIKVLDAHLVGSNASFNYTDESDLDVHIVANFESVTCDPTLLNLLYNFFKKYFNDKYEISIHGIPIELYVEDVNAATVSNGIYSLFNHEWIKFPEPIEIPDIDITDVFAPYEDRYNEIIEEENASEAEDLVNELYLLRKNALATGGEYSTGNLVFKEFRNLGYLDGLKQLVTDERAEELSLESLDWSNQLELREEEETKTSHEKEESAVDSDGNPLSPEQVAFFKDSQVRENNALIPCYHGTNVKFSSFKHLSDPGGLDFGLGFYFCMKKLGREFQNREHVLKCYLNIKKPLVVDSDFSKLDDILNREEELFGEGKNQDSIIQEISRTYGIDGIIVPEEGYVVAFFPNQIKLVNNKAPTLSSNISEEITRDRRNLKGTQGYSESTDIGYHYGDLGKADYRHQFGNRNTGGFGTGTYFVGKPINREEGRNSRSSRPEHVVDFSDYKLYKPLSNNQAYRLHDALLYFNNYGAVNRTIPTTWEKILDEYEEVMDDVFSTADQVEPVNGANLFDTAPLLKYIRKYIEYYPRKITEVDYYSLKDISKEIEEARLEESDKFYSNVNSLLDALRYSVSEDRLVKIIKAAIEDSSDIAPSTLIMQKLGYDGIDVRHLNHDDQGLSGLDNFGYGSVIYDLKEGFDEKEIVAGVEDFLASLGEKSVSLNWLRTQSKDNSATEPGRQYVNQLEDVELKAVGKRLGIKIY